MGPSIAISVFVGAFLVVRFGHTHGCVVCVTRVSFNLMQSRAIERGLRLAYGGQVK
jgi:hypothetical protein